MPRSRSTIREATLCVPNDILGDLTRVFGQRDWRPVAKTDWSATRVMVTMIPENRVGGCLLGATRRAPLGPVESHDNPLVTAARRAVGRWINATPGVRAYETAGAAKARAELKAARLASFEAVGRIAMAGAGEWIRPLAGQTGRKPRSTPAPKQGRGGPGGRRDRQYFALRCRDLPIVLVGRNSRYGRIIENSDPHASPPAQWDISAEFVVADKPLGASLDDRLRDLEKTAGALRPYVTALRAVASGMTDSLWLRAQRDAASADHGWRKNGHPRTPKVKGRKLGEAMLPPVPLIARRRVGGWYVPDKR